MFGGGVWGGEMYSVVNVVKIGVDDDEFDESDLWVEDGDVEVNLGEEQAELWVEPDGIWR